MAKNHPVPPVETPEAAAVKPATGTVGAIPGLSVKEIIEDTKEKKGGKSPVKKRYQATIYPGKNDDIPREFAEAILDLEKLLEMPVWFVVEQNGFDAYRTLDAQTLHGFRSLRNDIIDKMPVALLIESPGGDADVAYQVARMFQRRASEFIAIVAQYAKSAGTLVALGADRIIMGRDAELGPLDVQIYDSDDDEYKSALDAVQSLERLNAFGMSAIDQVMKLLMIKTGKRVDVLLPHVLTYTTAYLRPLVEKINAIDYTKKSRDLKVAFEYAVRLMKLNYPDAQAEKIAARLVEHYPAHGFVIDSEESGELVQSSRETFGLRIEMASAEMEKIFDRLFPFLDKLNVVGRVKEVGHES